MAVFDPEKLKKAKASIAFDPGKLEEVKKKDKSLLRKTGEFLATSETLPIAGGVAMGVAGIPTGPGAIPLAALGGAGGEAYRQLLAKSLGIESPKTSIAAAKKIGISGAEQAVAEATGQVIGPATRLIAKAPVVKPLLEGLGKTTGQLFQLMTKIKPEYAETLFKNPTKIFPSTMTKAKEAWRIAAKEAGIPIDDVSPEIINALKSGAKETAFGSFEKLGTKEGLSAAEAQTAKQAIDIALMPAAKTERNKPLVALYSKMRKAFTDRIGKESPALAKANKDYALAKAGEKFRSIFPQNLDQSPAYFRASILPTLAFGSSMYGNSDPVEGGVRALLAAAATSPLTWGAGISGAGGIRALSPVLTRLLLSATAAKTGDKLIQ